MDDVFTEPGGIVMCMAGVKSHVTDESLESVVPHPRPVAKKDGRREQQAGNKSPWFWNGLFGFSAFYQEQRIVRKENEWEKKSVELRTQGNAVYYSGGDTEFPRREGFPVKIDHQQPHQGYGNIKARKVGVIEDAWHQGKKSRGDDRRSAVKEFGPHNKKEIDN